MTTFPGILYAIWDESSAIGSSRCIEIQQTREDNFRQRVVEQRPMFIHLVEEFLKRESLRKSN